MKTYVVEFVDGTVKEFSSEKVRMTNGMFLFHDESADHVTENMVDAIAVVRNVKHLTVKSQS